MGKYERGWKECKNLSKSPIEEKVNWYTRLTVICLLGAWIYLISLIIQAIVLMRG